MEHSDFLEQIRVHSEALRAAALKAGPDAPVPTCPGWTVQKLVAHLARIQAWVAVNIETAATERPEFPPAPRDWAELHAWWVARQDRLLTVLAETPRSAASWTFGLQVAEPVAFWARRQAHEAAIHRLDAEHALYEVAGGVDPAAELRFDPPFAADGVAEALGVVLRARPHAEIQDEGTLLFHAADAGETWQLTLVPGERPELGPVRGSGVDADAVVAGTADAVYRWLWRRPNKAALTGRTELLDTIRTP
ncbi:uncharacterized protein (TIGR03083 family) [Crossiella equi]|uniref:Uncharacterized protein (TIGR03083 family) n=1 Tax=Crossiella equi TaxID=130796 RepID=A0ABS5AHB4_9PSEU|nr:maleylpyruvate isomerase N-terminal domain-containing protein [Crossiella equi]MBP2475969.1 uncharacterized protein (TIGR03083 family) [Crossiella equi]